MSRNDFSGERVGLVNGCMDPGDDYVINLLAELGLEAWPERVDPAELEDPTKALCGECGGRRCSTCLGTGLIRAVGRGFEGPDAGVAAELLASVRENRVAQAAGRYARNADDPDDRAIVYVRTDAIPEELVDVQVDGVRSVATGLQRDIVDALAAWDDGGDVGATAKGLAEDVGCDRSHVRKTLVELAERDVVQREQGHGPNPDRWWLTVRSGADDVDIGPIDGDVLSRENTDGKLGQPHTRSLVCNCPSFSGENSGLSVPTKMSIVGRSTIVPDGGDRDLKRPDGPPPDRVVPGR